MSQSPSGRDPHLTEIQGEGAERITALKWARYLSGTFGSSGALNALRLYAELGWISEGVRQTMTDYVRGLSGGATSTVAGSVDDDLPKELESLAGTPFHQHAKSLEFITTIANESLSHVLASTTLGEDLSGPSDLGDPSDLTGPGE
ncbi:archaellum component FlaD/FlaE [Halarchaeum rubridurum]|nr:FlaD/FlaE family flagellar protein [Halarchaeum rubridurum]MBP1954922.1 archaellum component FlaD/FlaE [Halarchaeum rubridurum]